MGQTNESVFGDPSLPASATITSTYRFGRVLNGLPLALAVAGRRFLLGGLDDTVAPEFLYLRDKSTGKKIARISLGRDPEEAISKRQDVERDLALLGREQFLKRHVRRWERY